MDNPAPVAVIDSLPAWSAALGWGLRHAMARGARRITCVDLRFDAWPLDDPALLADLTAWLRRPQRRLVLLAADYADLPRSRPRFAAWRRDWAHAVEPWLASADTAAALPTLLLDDQDLCVRLVDPVHGRGQVTLDGRVAHRWREEIDALQQRSGPGFPITTLGL